MNLLLAVISGASLIHVVISLIIAGVIFWLVQWLVAYIGIPDPFAKIIRVVIAIAIVVYLIDVLMSLGGEGFIRW